MTPKGSLLWGVAWVGEIGLRVGIGATSAKRGASTTTASSVAELNMMDGGTTAGYEDEQRAPWMEESPDYQATAEEVVAGCLSGKWGLGMICVGRVLEACVTGEIVRAK